MLDPRGTGPYALERGMNSDTAISASRQWLKTWDLRSGALLSTLPEFGVLAVRAPHDGHLLTCELRSGKLCLIDLAGDEPHRVLWRADAVSGHEEPPSVMLPDGSGFLVKTASRRITRYDFEGTQMGVMGAADDTSSGLAVTPDCHWALAGNADGSVDVFDLRSGRLSHTLAAHAAPVVGIDCSCDGALIASKGAGERVLLWRTRDWEQVAEIEEPDGGAAARWAPRFHPSDGTVLATYDGTRPSLRVWRIDVPALHRKAADASAGYFTTKVVLLGEGGVGKTALGQRIVADVFSATSATHGQQNWVAPALAARRNGAACETVLWDFAGQPTYRGVHALFIDDVDIALVLFDAAGRDSPLQDIAPWLELVRSGRSDVSELLVGARCDLGAPTYTSEELAAFCEQQRIEGGYVVTSALTGAGVPELVERVRSQIPWDRLTATVTTDTFNTVKDLLLVLRSRSSGQPLVNWAEFAASARRQAGPIGDATLRAAVANVQKHGRVVVLAEAGADPAILVVPELLINLAASITIEAEARADGLGSLDEDDLRHGVLRLSEVQELGPADRAVLLDAAITLFLRRAFCFRASLGNRTLLVFPSLLRRADNPTDGPPLVEDVVYRVQGNIENAYAALVVLLGYTNTFSRARHWRHGAHYEADEMLCGFHVVPVHPGSADFVLSYEPGVPERTRRLFQGLFETFLVRSSVRYEPLATKSGEDGWRHAELKQLREEQANSSRRLVFEEQLVHLKRSADVHSLAAPSCFVSYAWGERDQELWVEQLASDLANAGIDVVFDLWEMGVGKSISRFVTRVSQCDYVVVVGTPDYQWKRENPSPTNAAQGHILAAEADLFEQRLVMGSEQVKESVLAALLSGAPATSLPVLMEGRAYADFRSPQAYFGALLDLLIAMFKISDPQITTAVRRAIREADSTW